MLLIVTILLSGCTKDSYKSPEDDVQAPDDISIDVIDGKEYEVGKLYPMSEAPTGLAQEFAEARSNSRSANWVHFTHTSFLPGCRQSYCTKQGQELKGFKNGTYIQVDSRSNSHNPFATMYYRNDVKNLKNNCNSVGCYHNFQHNNFNDAGTLYVRMYSTIVGYFKLLDVDVVAVQGNCFKQYFKTWSEFHEIASQPPANENVVVILGAQNNGCP